MKLRQVELQAQLSESLRSHRVAGASVAVFHEGFVTTAAAGVTNVTTGVPLTTHTVMHVGSITKVLNATLVMQLLDDGAIELDQPVVRYLPDLRLRDHEALRQITVRMLLNHTCGIDGEILPDCGHDEETIERGIARFSALGQVHAPGAEFSYCNAGAVIAGYLIQRLTGKSWYRLIRERIFERLQMKHAVTLPEEALLHRASVGHHLEPGSNELVRTSFAFLPLSFAPAGATLMMSAEDLVTFARAHISEGAGADGVRLLSKCACLMMQQTSVDNSRRSYTCGLNVGLGWMLRDGVLMHDGGAPGAYSSLYAHPDGTWAAAILTNSDIGYKLASDLMEPWLREVADVKPWDRSPLDRPAIQVVDWDRYVGVYESVSARYEVRAVPEGLALCSQSKWAICDTSLTEATAPQRLIFLGEDKFLLEAAVGAETALPEAFRIFAFLNPSSTGKMCHLGWGARLFPRIS